MNPSEIEGLFKDLPLSEDEKMLIRRSFSFNQGEQHHVEAIRDLYFIKNSRAAVNSIVESNNSLIASNDRHSIQMIRLTYLLAGCAVLQAIAALISAFSS